MNRMLKKAVAVMLAVFTVTSVIPFTAFAQNPSDVSYTEDESFALDGSNAIGNEISELSQQQEEAEEGADYAVSWVEIEGNLATVDLVNIESCTVEVAIFSENGRMLASGYTDAPERAGTAKVWIDIDEMPEFFVAEVFLLDENMASLCDSYYCDRYTESFQEFLDLTIYDFEDQIVVNYDEEIDNNFAVAKDGTQEAEQNGDKNILVSADDENGVYVFENADKTITGVSVGENLFYDLGDGDYILIKVASNITEGNLTTVTADDAEIGDLYDCIKIDETAVIVDESCVDTTDMDSSLTLVGVEKPAPKFRAIDVSGEIGAKVGLDLLYEKKGEPFKIEGEITAEVTASVKFYHKTKGKNKTEFKLDTKYSIGYDIVFSASGSKEKGVDLPKLKLSILPGLTFESKLTLKFEVSGSVGIEGGKTIHRGFSYDNKNKTRTWNTEEEEWFPKSKGLSFEIKTELEITATLEGLKVLEAELKIGIGLGASGTFQDVINEEGAEKKHLCTRCCPAEFYAFANMKVSLKVGYKRLKITLLSFKVFDRQWKLFDFYFSNLSNDIFKTCPHYEYKTVFVVKDTAGNPLPNIKILDSATNQNGEHHTYYAPGNKYNVSVSPDGYLPATIIFNVEEEVTTVPITLTPVRMTDIKVSALPSKLSYFTGDTLDTAGLELTGSYNNGKTEKITSGFTVTPTKLTTAGTQTVTVDYNGLKTSFNVSVTQLAVTKLEIKTPPSKTEYFVGETVDTTGLVLTETYNNGVVKTITSGYTVTPEELTVPGSQTVTLTYGGKTCTYSINVTPVVATGISIKTPPSKTDYFVGDMLDTTGLVLEETYNNGDVVTITNGYTCTHAMLSEAGTQTVTITYGDNSCTFVIEVTPVVATGISVKTLPSKTEYFVGDVLDTTGLVLEETYNNGDVVTVTSGYTCTPLDLIDAGTQTVTVTYGENQCEFDVEVIPVVATKIEIVTRPDKTIYFTGDTLDTTGLTLKETYNNGDIVTVTSGYTCTPETLSTAGTQNITVTYGGNSCIFAVDVYDSSECSGVCGDNLIWFIDPVSWVLTIKGTGAMTWQNSAQPPWQEYRNEIKEIIIDDGVTTIENYSFSSCKNLVNLKIGKSVTRIGNWAFQGCSNLVNIEIPDSVESIGKDAFVSTGYYKDQNNWENGVLYIGSHLIYAERTKSDDYAIKPGTLTIADFAFERSGITGVTVPDSVTHIGNSSFYVCNSLVNVTLGKNIVSIDSYAFSDCEKLIKVTIPSSVTYMSSGAFKRCKSLISITVEENNAFYSSDEYGVLFNKDRTELLQYPAGNSRKNYTIPDGVTAIAGHAFNNSDNLTAVETPDSVTDIGEYAFYSCNNLEDVTIPYGVTVISHYAFANCSKITSISLPESVTDIEYFAFFASGLTNIKLSNNISTIGNCAFESCNNLTNVTIPDSVTSMGDSVFYNCSSLTSATLSSGLSEISYATFYNCCNLQSVSIPDNITRIRGYAFFNCEPLTTIKLGNKLTSIDSSAFYYCNNLTDVYYTGTEDEWKAISIGTQNEALTSATIHYNYVPSVTQSVINVTQTVNSSAKSIAPPLIPVYPTDSSVKKVMVSNAVVGNRYTLIALDQTEREYSLDNLVFIDNTIAEKKSFWLSFMPKSFDNPVVLVIGDFGSGVEQRRCNVYDGTAVDSITLSDSVLEMYMGQEPVQLSYEITPEPVEIKTVLWSSDNNSVAQVDGEGNVYPCAPGKATITATTAQGGVTASCEVTVTERVFEISWILTDKTVTEEVTEGYSIAEYADTGRYGYSFNGWAPAVPNRMPGNDLSFTAVYEPVICNVLFDANGGLWADGTTESITSSVAFDSEITAPQSPSKQGYIFSGWSLDGENTETDTGIMNDVDGKEFIAVWIPATDTRYTVETYVMNTKGEYEKSSQIYSGTTDETVYASYDVEEGFVLNDEKSVLSGVVKGDNSLVLKVYTDRNAYTFTTVADGVSTSADYLYGATVAEPAEPSKAGYKFIGWNNSIPSTMPAENVTVTAEFVKSYICPDCGDEILGEAEINAHITAEGRMKATVKIKNNNGSKTINYGETLRLTAITNNMPADAKIYWYIDGEMKGEGETFNVRFESGTKTVEVKIVDSNGNVLKNAGGNEIKDSESVTVKGGFFQKIISFFKNLFGMNRTVIQSVFKGIF